ncbi:MAG: Macrolide export ATP-binding/permease protein MacB [Deltaproteobacteria bacterium ADurb.Bin510]|nr:MAG: Macrolide export ATP-binding/permease protein MacB [Deltaproteobacteria bacterium ADurb.Bin510]
MISLTETIRISFKSLWANKMRSALTMLGIVIGVAAVIAMLAIGTGASRKIQKEVSSVGSNLLIVMPGSRTQGGMRMGSGSQMSLTTADAVAIARDCRAVAAVAPTLREGCQVVYGNQNWATSVQGTTEDLLTVNDSRLTAGRNLSEQDVRNSTKVCIIGQTVIDNLFGGANPIGEVIRINKVPFTVIGALESKGQGPMGQDQDDVIYIPITTAAKRVFGGKLPGQVGAIMVKAKSEQVMDRAESQISELLRQRHHIGIGKDDDFTVRNMTQMLKMAQQFTKVMTMLLGAIASVSLLVGGIGIMNIMLVSVTERTREIGIRMAVGAKAGDIRRQFLIEALVLSLLGGLIGIVLGALSAFLISHFAGWNVAISLWSVLLAVGFAAFIGVFFGYYPAYKASLLNPIEALRYE